MPKRNDNDGPSPRKGRRPSTTRAKSSTSTTVDKPRLAPWRRDDLHDSAITDDTIDAPGIKVGDSPDGKGGDSGGRTVGHSTMTARNAAAT
jgi:hypothetical protein